MKMKTIVQRAYGQPEAVLSMGEAPRPVPGPGEVLVEVRATSVNTPDWLTTLGVPKILRLGTGLLSPKRQIRGSDFSGVVLENPPLPSGNGLGVRELEVGTAVFGSTWSGDVAGSQHGSFAEYVVVPATQLARLPPAITFEQGAASVMSGVTALQALRDVAAVKPGQRVLINGASGGVGLFAIQIARALGATVTAVCSARNAELVRDYGAQHVIDYAHEDFTQGTERYDVVMDNVMNHALGDSARVLVDGGVLLPNSVGSGEWFGSIPTMLGATLFGSKQWRTTNFTPSRENLEALAALIESGAVRVPIDRTFPLADAGKAVAHMASRRARGKVVLSVSTTSRQTSTRR